ncbi:MAG: hypothetical protein P9M14_02180 [Candidatus Alcyoniella australis]|nr:hypothetical protein [Candidatus Alcyoniella australis]
MSPRPLALAVLLALLLCATAAAQDAAPPTSDELDLSIEARVDRSTIQIGDLIDYTLHISWNDAAHIDPPDAAIDLSPFIVRDYSAGEIRKLSGRNELELSYKLTIYQVGSFEIPPFRVAYTRDDGSNGVLRTERIGVTVQSLNPALDSAPREIKPPVDLPVDWAAYLRWALPLLLALLAIAVLTWWLARRHRSAVDDQPEKPIDPELRALERLDALAGRDLETPQQRKTFVFELSEVLREYIQGRFGFGALEMTAAELLQALPEVLPQSVLDDVAPRIVSWDLIKFAKSDDSAATLREDCELVREIVRDTAPSPDSDPAEDDLEESPDQEAKP